MRQGVLRASVVKGRTRSACCGATERFPREIPVTHVTATPLPLTYPVHPSVLSPFRPIVLMPFHPTPAPTVLVVDDEPAVRLLVERVLVEAGYRVLTAMGGAEALELLEQAGTVDLLLADLRMPVMSGTQLARKVAQSHPDIRVMIMAAYPSEDPMAWRVIMKPFPPDLLENEIRRTLEGPSARASSGEFPAHQ